MDSALTSRARTSAAPGEELYTRMGFVRGDPQGPLGTAVHGEYGKITASRRPVVAAGALRAAAGALRPPLGSPERASRC